MAKATCLPPATDRLSELARRGAVLAYADLQESYQEFRL